MTQQNLYCKLTKKRSTAITRSAKTVKTKIRERINRPVEDFSNYITKNPSFFLVLLLIFVLGVSFRFYVCLRFGTLQRDEAQHSLGGIFFSRLLLNNIGNLGSYIADYPTTLGSIWFYPFGYSLLAAFEYPIFGYTEFAARLPSLIFSLLLIHATTSIAKEIEPGKRISLIAAFLVATSSIIVIVGSAAMVDIPVTTLMTYSILFWIKGVKSGSKSAFLKAGALGGIAGLMKPTGIFVLLFMIAFEILRFLISRNTAVFSKGFWKGIGCGFLIFTTWWGSAVIVNFTVNGWVGNEALKGITYWFDFTGIFEKYIPPWYSPPWYKIEAWSFYPNQLISMMGILPFIFAFVGVGARLKKLKMVDLSLILFAIGVYVLQTFASNKNPRYIIPCLPILYAYSSVGVNSAYADIMGNDLLKATRIGTIKKCTAFALVMLVLAGGFIPMLSAVQANYIQGMLFGDTIPIRESLQIVGNDGNAGIIMPDSEENSFNVQTLTFYIASIDHDRKYGCCSPPSDPQQILSLQIGEKEAKYVLVYNSNSSISKFVQSTPEHFAFLGQVQNVYGTILVYRVQK